MIFSIINLICYLAIEIDLKFYSLRVAFCLVWLDNFVDTIPIKYTVAFVLATEKAIPEMANSMKSYKK